MQLLLVKDKSGRTLNKLDIILPNNIPVFSMEGSVTIDAGTIENVDTRIDENETVHMTDSSAKNLSISVDRVDNTFEMKGTSNMGVSEYCKLTSTPIKNVIENHKNMLEEYIANLKLCIEDEYIKKISIAMPIIKTSLLDEKSLLLYLNNTDETLSRIRKNLVECIKNQDVAQKSLLSTIEEKLDILDSKRIQIMSKLNLSLKTVSKLDSDIKQHIRITEQVIELLSIEINPPNHTNCVECADFFSEVLYKLYPFYQAKLILKEEDILKRIKNVDKQKFVFQICLDTIALRVTVTQKANHMKRHQTEECCSSDNMERYNKCVEAYKDILDFGENLITEIESRCKKFVTILDQNATDVNGVYSDFLLNLNDYHLPFKLCAMVNSKSVIHYSQWRSFELVEQLIEMKFKKENLQPPTSFYNLLRTKTIIDAPCVDIDNELRSNLLSLQNVIVESQTKFDDDALHTPLVDVLSDVAHILEFVVGLSNNHSTCSKDWSIFNSISQSICDIRPIANEERMKHGLVKKLLILSNEIYQNCGQLCNIKISTESDSDSVFTIWNINSSITYYKNVYDLFLDFRSNQKDFLQLVSSFYSQQDSQTNIAESFMHMKCFFQDLQKDLNTNALMRKDFSDERFHLELYDIFYDTFYSVNNNFDYISTHCITYLKMCDDFIFLVDQSNNLSSKLVQLLDQIYKKINKLHDIFGDFSTLETIGVVVSANNHYSKFENINRSYVEQIETDLQRFRNQVEKLNKKFINLMDRSVKIVQHSADLMYNFRDSIQPIFPNFVRIINQIHEQLHNLSENKSKLCLILTSNCQLEHENKLLHINNAIQHQWVTLGECYQYLLRNEINIKRSTSFPCVLRTQQTITRAKACYMLCRIEEGFTFVKFCDKIMRNSSSFKNDEEKYQILASMFNQQLSHLKNLVENRINEMENEELVLIKLFHEDSCSVELLQHMQAGLSNSKFITLDTNSNSPSLTVKYDSIVDQAMIKQIDFYIDNRSEVSTLNTHLKLFHHIYSQRIESLKEISVRYNAMRRMACYLVTKITSLNEELIEHTRSHINHDKCWNFTTLDSFNIVVDNYIVWQQKIELMAKLSQMVRCVTNAKAQEYLYSILLDRTGELLSAKKLTWTLMSEYFLDLKHMEWMQHHLTECEYDCDDLDKFLDSDVFVESSLSCNNLTQVIDLLSQKRILISSHYEKTSLILNLARIQLETMDSLDTLLPYKNHSIMPLKTIFESFKCKLNKLVDNFEGKLGIIKPHLKLIAQCQLIFHHFYSVAEMSSSCSSKSMLPSLDNILHSIFLLKKIPARAVFSKICFNVENYLKNQLDKIMTLSDNNQSKSAAVLPRDLEPLIQTSLIQKQTFYELFTIWKQLDVIFCMKWNPRDINLTLSKLEKLRHSDLLVSDQGKMNVETDSINNSMNEIYTDCLSNKNLIALKKKIITAVDKLYDATKRFLSQDEWLHDFADKLNGYINNVNEKFNDISECLTDSMELKSLNKYQGRLDRLTDDVSSRIKSIDTEIIKIGHSFRSLWYVDFARKWCSDLVEFKHRLVYLQKQLEHLSDKFNFKVNFYQIIDTKVNQLKTQLETNEHHINKLQHCQLNVILDDTVSFEAVMNVIKTLDGYMNDMDYCRPEINKIKRELVRIEDSICRSDDNYDTINDQLYIKVCTLEWRLSNFDAELQSLKKRLLLEATTKDAHSLAVWLDKRKGLIMKKIQTLRQQIFHSITKKVLDGYVRFEYQQVDWLAERFAQDIQMILIVSGNLIEEYSCLQLSHDNNQKDNYSEILSSIFQYSETIQAELQLVKMEYTDKLRGSCLFEDNLSIHLEQLDNCLVFGELIEHFANIETIFKDKISFYRKLFVDSNSEFVTKHNYFIDCLCNQQSYWKDLTCIDLLDDAGIYHSMLANKMTSLKDATIKLEILYTSKNISKERLELIEDDIEKCNQLKNFILTSCNTFPQLTAYVSQMIDLKCELYQHRLFVFNSTRESIFEKDHSLSRNLENLIISIDHCEQLLATVLEEFSTGYFYNCRGLVVGEADCSNQSPKSFISRIRVMQNRFDRPKIFEPHDYQEQLLDLVEVAPILDAINYLMVLPSSINSSNDNTTSKLSVQAELGHLLESITDITIKITMEELSENSPSSSCLTVNCSWLNLMEAIHDVIHKFISGRQYSKFKDCLWIYKLIQLLKKQIRRQQKCYRKLGCELAFGCNDGIENLSSFTCEKHQFFSKDVEKMFKQFEDLNHRIITTKMLLKKFIRKQYRLEKYTSEFASHLDRVELVTYSNETPLSHNQFNILRKNLEHSKICHIIFEYDLFKAADDIERLADELITVKNSFDFNYHNYDLQYLCIENLKRYAHRKAICSNMVNYLSDEYNMVSADLDLMREFGEWLAASESLLKQSTSFKDCTNYSNLNEIVCNKNKLNRLKSEALQTKKKFNVALRRLLVLPIDSANPVESFHSMASSLAQRWITFKRQLTEKSRFLTAQLLLSIHASPNSLVDKTNWKSLLIQSNPFEHSNNKNNNADMESCLTNISTIWPKQTNSNKCSQRYQNLKQGAFVTFLLENNFQLKICEAVSIFSYLSKNKRYVKYEDFIGVFTPRISVHNVLLKEDNHSINATEYIDDQLIDVLFKCTCEIPLQIKRVDGNKLIVGKKGKLHMIRVVKSTVMVRVGGGWENLADFIAKCDPCRVTGHRVRSSVADTCRSTKWFYQSPYFSESEINSGNQLRNRPSITTTSTLTKLLLSSSKGEILSVSKVLSSTLVDDSTFNDDSFIHGDDSNNFSD